LPETGNKPLCLRIHRQHRVVLYASDDAFIDFAVVNEKGWRELEVPPKTANSASYPRSAKGHCPKE